jgi:hypothetical protein
MRTAHNRQHDEPMVRGVEGFAEDQNQIQQRGKQSLTTLQNLIRHPEANAAKGGAQGQDGCVQDPDARSKEFENRQKQEVCAWRGVLKEIDIGPLAVQHALGIQPKKDLIATLQYGDSAVHKKVEIEKQGDTQQDESGRNRR